MYRLLYIYPASWLPRVSIYPFAPCVFVVFVIVSCFYCAVLLPLQFYMPTMHLLLFTLIAFSTLSRAQYPYTEATRALTTTISTNGFVITEFYTTISTVTYTLNQLLLGSSTSCPPGFLGGFIGPAPTFVPACLFCPSGFWYDRSDCQPYSEPYYSPVSWTPTPTLGGPASTFVTGMIPGGPLSLVEYSATVRSVSGYEIHMPDLAFYPETTIVTGGFSVTLRQELSSVTIPYGGPATTVNGVVEYSVKLPLGYFLAPIATTATATASEGSAGGAGSGTSSLAASPSTTSAQSTAASSASVSTTGTTVAPNQGSAARLGLSSLAVSGSLGCVVLCLVFVL